MSEYQYHEWQTLERPLSAAEQKAVNELSSHIDVTSTHASVTYNWSSFRHDPINVLANISMPTCTSLTGGRDAWHFVFQKD